MTTTTFYSADIACDGCTSSIQEALSKLAGVASVSGDHETKRVKVEFHDTVDVSCRTGDGLDRLRSTISRRLASSNHERATAADEHAMHEVRESLARALELAAKDLWDLRSAELIALELRVAAEALMSGDVFELSSEVLGRVFSQFCVGK